MAMQKLHNEVVDLDVRPGDSRGRLPNQTVQPLLFVSPDDVLFDRLKLVVPPGITDERVELVFGGRVPSVQPGRDDLLNRLEEFYLMRLRTGCDARSRRRLCSSLSRLSSARKSPRTSALA